ncbi:MAG: tRNA dihydrouridine(20/20a) synthase DusA [Dokdonella sp.]|uniref:tRNA dihydrouridine(20/20a) synthase DusA n=1 Tax=Dokdonella sp. TaxID=2291710 RepID=UPI0025B8437A|nr:tRNA dihydrouridine(20/20a) synthase DusA [Dokdonella sp.]MBX3700956.1 tRNA dihydrouridine(20/20a) synthase DusA [Dokdonella sp.]
MSATDPHENRGKALELRETSRYEASVRLSVAPMMDWTDRHCRYFHRLLAPHALLYTEMVTAPAVLHGDREHLLGFDAAEQPVALQLGGSAPQQLAQAARIGAAQGYAEINLNVGCPSDRVQSGRFGACLMREPDLVADCVVAMRAAVADLAAEVTVKCRIGVDEQDEDAALAAFVERVAGAGCTRFIVHARKAWLAGLSPKENREVPPLNYERVYRLKREHPQLHIVINGGITTLDEVNGHLRHVDGVMLGRTAYHEPYRLAELEHALFGVALPDRDELLLRLRPHVETHLAQGGRLQHITRHILGLYQGLPGARAFRRVLSEQAHQAAAGWPVVEAAIAARRAAGAQAHAA